MHDKSYDLILYNANVITMDSYNEEAEMIGITGDKFSFVGDFNSQLLNDAENAIDINGKTIIPGFIDLHTHLWKEADIISINLGSFTTYEDTLKRIEVEVARKKNGEWIFASNWDESKWEDKKEFLKKEDLDNISPDNPVYASREDGHLVSINSLAFTLLPLKESHPGVEKDSKGVPTGILKDVWLDLTPYYKEIIPRSILKSTQIAASKGITSVVDNLTIMPKGQKNIIEAYFSLDLDNKLPIRIFLNLTCELMEETINLGIQQNHGTSKLRYSGFKGFFDGAIGAYTALISFPYQCTERRGDQFINEDNLINQIVRAEQNNYTLCIHAIGDQAIEKLLNCYEIGIKRIGHSSSMRNHRIEHAEMITDEQIKKVKGLGILLSMQPNFLKWQYTGELYEQRLGKSQYRKLNRFAVIQRHGLRLHFGSDNMPLSPLFGIKLASSFPSTEVRIPVLEALKAYTINNAEALFMQSELGSISVGKYADFVILSKSIKEIPTDQIKDDLIEKTIVGGKEVYISES
ncbi:MAG: amidohydrolase [Candidatus Hodarchaeota archaeon]